jgi:hypothetical protein
MTLQTASQILMLVGVVISAIGVFGSYHYGKNEEKSYNEKADKTQHELKAKIEELQASTSKIEKGMELIFEAVKVKEDTWMEVEMKNIPQGVTDHLLLLFKSDKGNISGKVRIKGSKDIYSFSTIANEGIPLTVRNLWLPEEGKYKDPTIMEFAVTEKTELDASLKIFTAGWIHDLGKPFGKPH